MSNTIVLIQYSSNYSGSTISGMLVAEALRTLPAKVHIVFGYPGPFVELARERGFDAHVIPHANWLRNDLLIPFLRHWHREARAARAFDPLFQTLKPRMVYVNTIVSLAGAIAARRRGLPLIWHVRELFANVGGEMKCPGGSLGRRFARQVLTRHADRVVVISEAVRRNVLGDGAAARRAAVIPNAIEEAFFTGSEEKAEARQGLGLPLQPTIVGVPGTLRPMKGHPFFLKAARLLVERIPEARFAFAGEGDPGYVEKIKKLAEDLGLAARVHFLGRVTRMPSFYRACDVVCVPSRAEPFGRTVIEAFACGTPVVGARVGGIAETVRHGENGLLVPYGDEALLAERIALLLRDKALAAQLAATAAHDARSLYHRDTYIERIAGIAREMRRDKLEFTHGIR
jgi:glycosyltransferase involved in cell wall biosynthesis